MLFLNSYLWVQVEWVEMMSAKRKQQAEESRVMRNTITIILCTLNIAL